MKESQLQTWKIFNHINDQTTISVKTEVPSRKVLTGDFLCGTMLPHGKNSSVFS